MRSFLISLPVLALLAAPAPGQQSVLTDEVVGQALGAAIAKVDGIACIKKNCLRVVEKRNEILPLTLSESRTIMEFGVGTAIIQSCGRDGTLRELLEIWKRTKNKRQTDVAEILYRSGTEIMAKRKCDRKVIEELFKIVNRYGDALKKEIETLQKEIDRKKSFQPFKVAS